MKNIILITITSFYFGITTAQVPLTQIEGRLDVHLPMDTTSTHVGFKSGIAQDAMTGYGSTFVGAYSGNKNTSGTENSFYGAAAGRSNTTGSSNSYFGYNSGADNEEGEGNSFFGAFSGDSPFTDTNEADDNSFFGVYTGASITTGSDNSFFGAYSGQDNESGGNNSFFGEFSGYQNVSGDYNAFFGGYSGEANNGKYNSYFGYSAGEDGQNGKYNSFFGSKSGLNTEGEYNNFFGYNAGYWNDTGDHNTAIGSFALHLSNRGGSYNTAVGDSSMYNVDNGGDMKGDKNAALGAGSLFAKYQNETHESVAVGYQAGYDGGFHSVFLGHKAGKGISNINDVLYIDNREGENPLIYGEFDNDLIRVNGDFHSTGKVGIGTELPEVALHIGGFENESRILLANGGDIFFKRSSGANKAVLTLHTDDHTYLDAYKDLKFRSGHNLDQIDVEMIIKDNGNVGIGENDPSHPLHMGNGAHCTAAGVWTDASDISKKYKIQKLLYGLNEVLSLSPKSYNYKIDSTESIGFIAQEIELIIPEVVSGKEGNKGIAYGQLTAVLVNAIKEHQTIVEKQQTQLNHQSQEMQDIKAQLNELKTLMTSTSLNENSAKHEAND